MLPHKSFGKEEDYILAFQSGKGLNDQLLQKMILGRHLRKENALYCVYDEKKSIINFKDFGSEWPERRRKPTPSDAKLYWNYLEDTEKWIKPRVSGYWFWGFMRNSKRIYEVAKQKDIPFYFVDHAYMYHIKHSFFKKHGNHADSYYRVVRNGFVIDKITDTKDKRYLQLKAKFPNDNELEIKDWNRSGNHILIFPPSYWLCQMIGTTAEKLLNDTIEKLKQHTDREIRIRYKKPNGNYNPVPLEKDFENAHAVVSFQSSAAVKAITKGIPSFTMMDKHSSVLPMSLSDLSKIETPIYPDNRYEWLCNLANHQFLTSEIQNGYAKRYLDEQDA